MEEAMPFAATPDKSFVISYVDEWGCEQIEGFYSLLEARDAIIQMVEECHCTDIRIYKADLEEEIIMINGKLI